MFKYGDGHVDFARRADFDFVCKRGVLECG